MRAISFSKQSIISASFDWFCAVNKNDLPRNSEIGKITFKGNFVKCVIITKNEQDFLHCF